MSEIGKIIIPEIREIEDLLCKISENSEIVIQIKNKLNIVANKYNKHILFFKTSKFNSKKNVVLDEFCENIEYNENLYNN